MKKRIAVRGMALLLALSGLTAPAKAVELIPMEELVAALLGMTGQATWRTETAPDETAAETVSERLPRETTTAEPLPADTPATAQEWAPDEIMPAAVTEEPLPPAASEAAATLPPVMPEPADAPSSVMPEPVVTLPLSAVEDCYNLLPHTAPLMLTRQTAHRFQVIWPEKADFPIEGPETFCFRAGDRLYFSRWYEDPDYREEVVVRHMPDGAVLEQFRGSLQQMSGGRWWLLEE